MNFASYRMSAVKRTMGSLKMIAKVSETRANAVGQMLGDGLATIQNAKDEADLVDFCRKLRAEIQGVYSELPTGGLVSVLFNQSREVVETSDPQRIRLMIDSILNQCNPNEEQIIFEIRFALVTVLDFAADAMSWWAENKERRSQR